MAAIELAMIVPMMAVMFIAPSSSARRSSWTAASCRSPAPQPTSWRAPTRKLHSPTITDIMKAGSYIMAPYSHNPLQIVIREL
jgi:hypothetical protein